MPIFKKGKKDDIANYRPVANLCSGSKIFECLILNRINEIESEMNVDFTGPDQHGFKKGLWIGKTALWTDSTAETAQLTMTG